MHMMDTNESIDCSALRWRYCYPAKVRDTLTALGILWKSTETFSKLTIFTSTAKSALLCGSDKITTVLGVKDDVDDCHNSRRISYLCAEYQCTVAHYITCSRVRVDCTTTNLRQVMSLVRQATTT